MDGSKGTATPKFSKVARYLSLACEVVVQGKASERELQIIGGGFVYIAMFLVRIERYLEEDYKLEGDVTSPA